MARKSKCIKIWCKSNFVYIIFYLCYMPLMLYVACVFCDALLWKSFKSIEARDYKERR